MRQTGFSILKFSIPVFCLCIMATAGLADLICKDTHYWILATVLSLAIIALYISSGGLFEMQNFIRGTDRQYNDAKSLKDFKPDVSPLAKAKQERQKKFTTLGIIWEQLTENRFVQGIVIFCGLIKTLWVGVFKRLSWVLDKINSFLWKKQTLPQDFILLSDLDSASNRQDSQMDQLEQPAQRQSKRAKKQNDNSQVLLNIFNVAAREEKDHRSEADMSRRMSFFTQAGESPRSRPKYHKSDRVREDERVLSRKIQGQFLQFLKKEEILESNFQFYVMSIKAPLADLVRQVIQKQNSNLSCIKILVEGLFDVEVDDNQLANDSQNSQRNKKLITIDDLLKSQADKTLSQGIWTASNKSANLSRQDISNILKQIEQLLSHRITLDSAINFGHIFPNDQQRRKTIATLQQLEGNLRAGAPLVKKDHQHDIVLQLNEINELLLWVLKTQINGALEGKLPEGKLFLTEDYTEPNRKDYIRVVSERSLQGTHYDIQTVMSAGSKDPWIKTYKGQGGEKNIYSIFVHYLMILKKLYPSRLAQVPSIAGLIQRTMI